MGIVSAESVPDGQYTGGTGHRAALFASFLGWTLDAFDFFLVTMSVSYIEKEFHRSDTDIVFSITLTMAFRPVGAFIFGLLADRYGRRLPLMIDLILYSIFEVLSGLAPSYAWFLLFRALFGIGMGGEWGVGATLAMEKVPPRIRGVLSGLLQEGYALGFLLAALCSYFVLPRWGWRPMFFIGGIPALLAIYVRLHVKESEVWEKGSKHTNWGQIGRSIISHWKIFFYLVLLMTAMNLISHGTQDVYPKFLENGWGFNPQRRALLTAFTMVGAISGGLLFGLYSDRFGRRRAIGIALTIGLAVIPIWALTPSVAGFFSSLSPVFLLYAGGFMMQFFVQGAWGVIPAHLAELSPDSVRGFMPGFAYQFGVLIASPIAQAETILARRVGYPAALAIAAAPVFLLGVIVAALGREKRGLTFGKDGT